MDGQGGPRSEAGRKDAHSLVIATLQQHAPVLLATARRHSLCHDDAQDAYQRALEIFLRRAGTVAPDALLPWLRTVVKHEAWAVRAARQRAMGAGEIDPEAHPAPADGPDECAQRGEELDRAAEALGRLKPQELRALVLKAQGHSYREIQAITGWTYTKVNRCLTEGRQALRERLAGIESGAECERWAPMLSAIADGEADRDALALMRPHLRACGACRATLRAYRSAPASVAALVPAAVFAPEAQDVSGSLLARAYEAVTSGIHERAAGSLARVQSGLDVVVSGKATAIAASTVALAGGSVAAVHEHLGPQLGSHAQAAAARIVEAPAPQAPAPAPLSAPQPSEAAPQRADTPAEAAEATQPAEPAASEFGLEPSGAEPAAPTSAHSASASEPAAPAPQRRSASRPSSSDRAAASGEFGP